MYSLISDSALSALCLCDSSTHRSAVEGGISMLALMGWTRSCPEASQIEVCGPVDGTELQMNICRLSWGCMFILQFKKLGNVPTDLEQIAFQQCQVSGLTFF